MAKKKGIVRDVMVCGVKRDDTLGRCFRIKALVDSGASMSVIPKKLARKSGAAIFKKSQELDGKQYDASIVTLAMRGRKCAPKLVMSVASDELANKARPQARMILGADYLEKQRVGLIFSEDPRERRSACQVKKLKHR